MSRKQQLLERVKFDNRILLMRNVHPAPSVEATGSMWQRFIATETQRMASLDLVPRFTERSALASKKRKRAEGPHGWGAPELKKQCLKIGISLRLPDKSAKRKPQLLAEYLAKSPLS